MSQTRSKAQVSRRQKTAMGEDIPAQVKNTATSFTSSTLNVSFTIIKAPPSPGTGIQELWSREKMHYPSSLKDLEHRA